MIAEVAPIDELISREESLNILANPAGRYGLHPVYDAAFNSIALELPGQEVPDLLDIIEQAGFIVPLVITDPQGTAAVEITSANETETYKVAQAHFNALQQVILSHRWDDSVDQSDSLTHETRAELITVIRSLATVYPTELTTQSTTTTEEREVVEYVFNQILDILTKDSYFTGPAYQRVTVKLEKAPIQRLLGAIKDVTGQSQAERQHLFRKANLKMILAGLINSSYSLFTSRNTNPDKQIITQEVQNQEELVSIYLNMDPIIKEPLFQQSIREKYAVVSARGELPDWKTRLHPVTYLMSASAVMEMFLVFGDIPVKEEEVAIWNILLGSYVCLNNAEQEKYSFFSTPGEHQKFNGEVTTEPQLSRETIPFIEEFAILLTATLEAAQRHYRDGNNLSWQTAALLKAFTNAYQLFISDEPKSVHHFSNFPGYSMNMQAIGNSNVSPEQKMRDWGKIYYQLMNGIIDLINPAWTERYGKPIFNGDDLNYLKSMLPNTMADRYKKAIKSKLSS